MAKRLGFIGLGNMGSRLAKNLAEGSGRIIVWDRSPDRRASTTSHGIEQHNTIADLVSETDVIFLSISDDNAVREVIGEMTSHDLGGKIIVDFSTIAPETSVDVASLVSSKGGRMLDAAVSGSTPQVESRQLTIFVGGPQDSFDAVRSLIEPLGRAVYHMGGNGSGLKMKLCVNALLGIGIASLAESLTLAQKLGLDKDRAIEALAGTAVISPSQQSKLELAKKNDYSHPSFSLGLMHKDLSLIMQEALSHALTLPVTAAAEDLAEQSMKTGAAKDFGVMIQTSEQLANVSQEK